MMRTELNDYEQFEYLLQNKAYGELDRQELLLTKAFVEDRVEYQQLRKVLLLQRQEGKESPKAPAALLATLQGQMPTERAYKVPAWAASIILICCSALAYWAGQKGAANIVREVHTIENYLPSDTIFLTNNPDTIYIEQIKYVVKKVPIWANTVSKDSVQTLKKAPNRGTSWQESEALQDLIVTGD